MNFLETAKAKLSKTLWKIQGKTSASYWDTRYAQGGNSGDGSYNELAQFKAEVIQRIVNTENIQTAIEYGCGDGNQLKLINYPQYSGYDVSPTAIQLCRNLFAKDNTKKFELISNYKGEKADLTLSLDVIYHLVEDAVFENHMKTLFDSSNKFVLVYSSNFDASKDPSALLERGHVRHRNFTEWIKKNYPHWTLVSKIDNRYKYNSQSHTGSLADFYLYKK